MTTLHPHAAAGDRSLHAKLALQIVVALGGLVPVGAGLAGVIDGPAFIGPGHYTASVESHFSYLSGLLLAIGILFWRAIPAIEKHGAPIRALTLIVFVGGLGRALALWRAGAPDLAMSLAFVMELVVTPAICLWQWRLARRMDANRAER